MPAAIAPAEPVLLSIKIQWMLFCPFIDCRYSMVPSVLLLSTTKIVAGFMVWASTCSRAVLRVLSRLYVTKIAHTFEYITWEDFGFKILVGRWSNGGTD